MKCTENGYKIRTKPVVFTDFSDTFPVARRQTANQTSLANSGMGKLGMQSITELATARKWAVDLVESSSDDETGERNMVAVYAIEKRILKRFRRVDSPAIAMALHQHIVCQFGEPDLDDRFVRTLGNRVLAAL
jgi:hypothetical protein